MEQENHTIKKYGKLETLYRGFRITAWAQKDERLPAYYGVARFRRDDDESEPDGRVPAPGRAPLFDGSDGAVEWAVTEAKTRIDDLVA